MSNAHELLALLPTCRRIPAGLSSAKRPKLCTPQQVSRVLDFFNTYGTNVVDFATLGGVIEQHFMVQMELVDQTTQVNEVMPVDRVVAEIIEQYQRMHQRTPEQRMRAPSLQDMATLTRMKRPHTANSAHDSSMASCAAVACMRPERAFSELSAS